jgi:hypothetical protein
MRTNFLPPATPSRDQTHPPVAFNPISKPKKSKALRMVGIVLLSVTGLSVIVVVAVIIFAMSLFNSLGSSCNTKRTSTYASAGQEIPVFNNLTIVPGVTGSAAIEQKQDGDCVDSLPTAWLQRTFPVNETAGEALSQVTMTLQGEGYTSPTHDHDVNPNASPCSVDQGTGLGLTFSSQSHPDITITMNCEDGDGTMSSWQSLPVSEVNAEVTIAAQS